MQAIILCGGLGTRLKSVIKDIPKPMAPINHKPFLEFIFEYLKKQGIKEVILAVSYKYEVIKEYFKDEFLGIKIKYSIEKEPLGTGGAIKETLKFVKNEAYVLNGDTFFDIDLSKLKLNESKICLALKQMNDFDRYGTVNVDEQDLVISFEEKVFKKQGLINGGIYLLTKDIFNDFALQEKFSFEEFLQENYNNLKARAEIFDDYFIDIGVPEDYSRFSQQDLKC
ncbi:D-glycero-D-manno-heptose 1-phosphate guanosyltransferase [Campylobacter jejuni]|uniref:D-glycero-D-manno-heptose 1-phosphate guanosyltransferase n=1 Tax=Campylobacter jejuni TaxID=197 RepID=UPI0008748AC9|nr:D-glycero-D-manno-heptose 1-phosphate guanosyltransferase [Campylobacter jejuni]EAK0364651.1 D-glycero-D-manno-heptose 1-phosphate guanosyltransferase [Campylobacter jejuni]EAK1829557.1 D-glycero-D-manno-heptose 1-phosphate guanosyltransferase [Campylobacter jejuni]EDP2720662.1 D-glycero-D-manno-heptose 1-phosphate guanosyltransferase [Campylobacter jejuni]EDP8437763.1 D-glycero-D-manno-heptose 1-phosphate guanosyltransferase [Campylobacter jejuni]ELA6369237.1 D-glycero-D-manno-heptose 1-ph